jgi:cold shock protein
MSVESASEQVDVTTSVVVDEEHDNHHVGKYMGQCKWFNDTYGYGFVTICDGPEKGKDIFVHHSGVKPLNSNYRTLRKGEYLNFDIDNGTKGLQAVNVRGINGGPLMCDFVNVSKVVPSYRSHYENQNFRQSSNFLPSSPDTPRAPRQGKLANLPQQMYANGQWLVVTKSGRKKNIAKYSKEGRMAMKQGKDNDVSQEREQVQSST